jgi:hypothetical protein
MLGLGHSLVGGTVLTGYNNTHALSFDATDDIVNTNSTFQSTFRGSFSVSFWMNSTTIENHGHLWGTAENGDTDKVAMYTRGGHRRLSLIFISDGNSMRHESNSITFAADSGSGDGGTEGVWKHFAVTWTKGSSGDGTATFHENGEPVTCTTTGGISDTEQDAYTNPHELYIGKSNYDGAVHSQKYAMKLDDWALWNVALSETAIRDIYNSGVPTDLLEPNGNYTNQGDLVAYYKLNEGSGTTATDETGGSNGTVSGGATYITDTP